MSLGAIVSPIAAGAPKQTGLTVHTLRYYEKIGLLQGIHRDANGYRQYGESDMPGSIFCSVCGKRG
ncbi:MerR family DNA-binding transcriptional regulator [Brevibacillus sp. SYP-B805]|uniref:MerR family DNA-binding transcriptional regulator n=1 Tax=Brevibacillus sp. SYP-B805 TaxID=1578199 RepID=UPI00321804B3